MGAINGVHHLAISTSDIKAQIAYFSDVLGMELVALYWMHGVEGAWHGFMKLNDSCSVAFVQTPQMKEIPHEIGKTHAGNPGNPSAGGTMQHLAFNVATIAELLTMQDRIRSRGIPVMGPIEHGMCTSIYFAGIEDMSLEVSTSDQAIDGNAWIDPEVVQLAGITADELRGFREPAAFARSARRVPQPALDGPGPHMAYPPAAYKSLMGMSDEDLNRRMSVVDPPVKVA